MGLKRSKIYELIRDGDLPSGKIIHGTRLWRESEIAAWIERTWSSANLEQGKDEQSPSTDTAPEAETSPNSTVVLPPLPASVYWSSSYLREYFGISRTSLHRWTKTKLIGLSPVQHRNQALVA